MSNIQATINTITKQAKDPRQFWTMLETYGETDIPNQLEAIIKADGYNGPLFDVDPSNSGLVIVNYCRDGYKDVGGVGNNEGEAKICAFLAWQGAKSERL